MDSNDKIIHQQQFRQANMSRPFSFSKDQQYEAVFEFINLYGLNDTTLDDGSPLQIDQYHVTKYQPATDKSPASLTFNATYCTPVYYYDEEHSAGISLPNSPSIPVMRKRYKLYMSPTKEVLEQLPKEEKQGTIAFKSLGKPSRILNSGFQYSLLPLQGHFFISAYEDPKPHRMRTIVPSLDTTSVRNRRETGHKLLQHSGFATPPTRISGLSDLLEGRSGVKLLHVTSVRDDQVHSEHLFMLAKGEPLRNLLQHACTVQQHMHANGVPTPKIIKPPTGYYTAHTGQSYAVQQLSITHKYHPHKQPEPLSPEQAASLGAALGKIHNLPADTAPEAGKTVLQPKQLFDSVEQLLHENTSPIQESQKRSCIKELLQVAPWERLRIQCPDLCSELGIDWQTQRDFVIRQHAREQENLKLPSGWRHGDIHPPNIFLDETNDSVQLIDWQLSGKGNFADELVLALYFFCTGRDGALDPELTKAFFQSYCQERHTHNPGTGNIPLTQQEIRVLANRVADHAKEAFHPAWVMHQNGASGTFPGFIKRIDAISAQMQHFDSPEGQEAFCKTFLGKELETYHDYSSDLHTAPAASKEKFQFQHSQQQETAQAILQILPHNTIATSDFGTLQATDITIKHYRPATQHSPAVLTFDTCYSLPPYRYNEQHSSGIELPKSFPIPLYRKRFKLYMSPQKQVLDALPASESLPQETFIPTGETLSPVSPDAEYPPLPLNGHFFIKTYEDPELHPTGEHIPPLQTKFIRDRRETGHKLLQHSGLASPPTQISGPSHPLEGKSGVKLLHVASVPDDQMHSEYLFMLAKGEPLRNLLQHACTVQQHMHANGVPTPEIIKPPTGYYTAHTGQNYAVQQLSTTHKYHPHTRTKPLSPEQAASLGAALGKIHNLPADTAPEAGKTVLQPETIIADVKAGLIWSDNSENHASNSDKEQMLASCIKELLQFAPLDFWRQQAPELCERLEINPSTERLFNLQKSTHTQILLKLPSGWRHGDIHSSNIFLDSTNNSALFIDWQLSGRGNFADEIVKTLYTCCTGADGALDPELTKAFFQSYCRERNTHNPKTGNTPLTQQEVAIIPQLLANFAEKERLSEWLRQEQGKSAAYHYAALKISTLPEQMQAFTSPEGQREFAQRFLGSDLDTFPAYTPSYQERLASHPREGHRRA